MYDNLDKDPVYAGDEPTVFQLMSAVIAVICILLTIVLVTIPSATVPFIILSIVIIAPYLLGSKTDDSGDGDFNRKPDHPEPCDSWDL